jgi:hypothetical protein
MPDLLPRLRAWTRARLLLDRSAPDIESAIDRLTAVYSSHPTAPLSLLCRLPALTAGEVVALDERHDWLRLPAMRGSIFAMPTEQAGRLLTATATPLHKLAGRLKYAGFDLAGYEAMKPRILGELETPKDAAALQAALPVQGKLMPLVRVMAFEGLVLRISQSLRTDKLAYVSTEARLGRRLELPDPEESLAWLAGRYLRAFGPARLADFAWWVGTTKGRAKRALATVDSVDVGEGLLLPTAMADAFGRVEPLAGDEIDVLPKWDPLTMGYEGRGRQRLVHDRHAPAILNHMGDGLPLLLRGGRAVATWSRRFTGDRLVVEVTPLDGERVDLARYEARLEEVGRLLGAVAVRISLAG